MGEAREKVLRLVFDRSLKLEFHGANVARHTRYVAFQMTEVAVPRELFRAILERLRWLASPPPLWVPSNSRDWTRVIWETPAELTPKDGPLDAMGPVSPP